LFERIKCVDSRVDGCDRSSCYWLCWFFWWFLYWGCLGQLIDHLSIGFRLALVALDSQQVAPSLFQYRYHILISDCLAWKSYHHLLLIAKSSGYVHRFRVDGQLIYLVFLGTSILSSRIN
jgi:hypothetical protein